MDTLKPKILRNLKIELVVTRHPALLEYLVKIGLANENTRVISHASEKDVIYKHVCGVLPHSLSSKCQTFTEIPLSVPLKLRGKELDIEQIKEFAGEPVTYRVRALQSLND